MKQITILLIDHSRLFREGIKTLLSDSNFVVIGEASSLRDAMQQMTSGGRPDLLLLDLEPADDADMGFIRELRQNKSVSHIVVLTSEITRHRLAQSLSAGVDGYLLKDMSPDALAQSLRLVLLGEKVFPTDLAPLLMNGSFEGINRGPAVVQPRGLSEREIQILNFLVNGLSNKSIANRLDVTEGTVKVHLKSLLRKLNVINRTQAAIWALNSGIGAGQPPAPSTSPRRLAGASGRAENETAA